MGCVMADEQRPRVSRQEWAKRVERWQDSGLTAREYARELNINAGTLRQWKYRFDGERRGARPRPAASNQRAARGTPDDVRRLSKSGFVELTAAVSAATPFELCVGNYRLQIPPGFDEAELTRLLRAVGRAS